MRPTSGHLSVTQYQDLVLAQRKGFALFGNVTGGRGGTIYVVTNTSDSGAGSLRDALTGGSNRWVIFDPRVFQIDTPTTIALSSTINMRNNNNITLDGFGANVVTTGKGISTGQWLGVSPWTSSVSNNLCFINLKMGSTTSGNFDNLTIDGTDRAWFYHLEALGGGDGNIDITLAGTGPNANGFMSMQNVYSHDTLSSKNCLISDQTEGFGDWASPTSSFNSANPTDPNRNGGDNRITICDSRFKDGQRNPIVVNYWAHEFNNYHHGWTLEGPTVMGLMGQMRAEYNVLDGTGAGANASKGHFSWTFAYADASRRFKRWLLNNNVYLGGATALDASGGTLNPAGNIFSIPYGYTVENPQLDNGAALIGRLASSNQLVQGRAGVVQRPGLIQLCGVRL